MKTAVLIAAHDEELVIAKTLASVSRHDIFVASDNSTDRTAVIARLFTNHVLEIKRGGKGRAIQALLEHYDIVNNYDAFLIVDADTLVGKGTIRAFEVALAPGVAGAVGRIEAGNNTLVSYWRSIQHFMTAKVYRRGMAVTNCINIMSGTCAIWTTEAFKHIDWNDTPTEDLDFTYQLHRKKLGRIAYAPEAVVYTQEPLSLSDYCIQMVRWYRGYWMTNATYGIPFGRQSLDYAQAMFIFEISVNWSRMIATLLIPFGLVTPLLLWTYAYETIIIGIFALITAVATRNIRIVIFFPLIIWFSILDQFLNVFALLTYHRTRSGAWKSPKRLRMTLNQKGI